MERTLTQDIKIAPKANIHIYVDGFASDVLPQVKKEETLTIENFSGTLTLENAFVDIHPSLLTRNDIETAESLVRDGLWTLGAPPQKKEGTPPCPGMVYLKTALAALQEGRSQTVKSFPPALVSKLKIKGYTSVNSFRDLATTDPRIRQVSIMDVAIFAIDLAMQTIETDYLPPATFSKLAKVRQYSRE